MYVRMSKFALTHICRGSYLPPGESFEAYAVDLEQSLAHCSDVMTELPLGDYSYSTLNIQGFGSVKSISNTW